jgi:hypothetical protein
MAKYFVSWRETVSQIAEIEADSKEQAIELAKSGEFDDLQTEYIDREDDSFRAHRPLPVSE